MRVGAGDNEAVTELVGELQQLAYANDALSASALGLAGLRHLTASRFGRQTIDEIFELIDAALVALPVSERGAAGVIFGGGTDRWIQHFSERRLTAATKLGMSADTLRKRRDGSSPYDELARSLAVEILALAPVVDSKGASPGASRWRVASLWWAAVAVALAVLTALVLATRGSDEAPDSDQLQPTPESIPGEGEESRVEPEPATDSTPAEPVPPVQDGIAVDGCDIPLGGAVGAVLPTEAVVEAIVTAVVRETISIECPTHAAEVWDMLWVQTLAADDGEFYRVVAPIDGGPGLVISETLYAGYFRIARPDGSVAQATAGFPIAVEIGPTHQILEFDTGSQLVTEGHGSPARWIAPPGVSAWLALGGVEGELGLPMTDVNFIDGVPRQEFQRGFGVLEGGVVVATAFSAEEIAADVAALGRSTEMILESFDFTSWWIDAEGTRQWIPDGAVWSCLGGAEAREGDITPGWVIAAFPVGPIASCG